MVNRKTNIAVAMFCLGSLAATNIGWAGISQLNIGYYTEYGESLIVQGVGHSTVATAISAKFISGEPLPASHANPFVTFCLDINETLVASGAYWMSGGFADVPLTSQSTPAVRQANSLYRVANLYKTYSAGIINPDGTWIDKIKGAALQRQSGKSSTNRQAMDTMSSTPVGTRVSR